VSPRFLLVLVAVVVGTAAAAAQARPQHAALGRVGDVGFAPVRLSPAMRSALHRSGVVARGRIMATRNGKAFVRLGTPGSDHCYGVGTAGAAQFGYTCSDAFPSAQRPILDLSTFGADDGGPIHLIAAEGIAADGVATVALTDADGRVLARTPVTGNVYSVAAPPGAAVRLVALDGRGRMLFAVPK
jgi:hypothetical protein